MYIPIEFSAAIKLSQQNSKLSTGLQNNKNKYIKVSN